MQVGYLALLMSILCMSLGPILNKIALEESSVLSAACLNTLTCSSLSLVLLLSRFKFTDFAFRLKNLKFILSSMFYALAVYFMFLSYTIASPATASIGMRMYLPFCIVFSVVVFKKRIDFKTLMLICLVSIGAVCFGLNENRNFEPNGLWLAILSSGFFALHHIFLDKNSSVRDLIFVMFINNGLAFVFLLLTMQSMEINLNISHLSFLIIAATAILSSFLGTFFYYYGIKTVSLPVAAATRSLSPILTGAFSQFIFPRTYSAINIFGGVLCVGGTLLISLQKEKNNET